MNYRVIVSPNARQELYDDALWWAEHRDVDEALRWLDGFEKALLKLDQNPDQHPLARENGEFPFDLRQMLYGLSRKPTHRAVFEIRGQDVIVHGIRHLARRDLTMEDVE